MDDNETIDKEIKKIINDAHFLSQRMYICLVDNIADLQGDFKEIDCVLLLDLTIVNLVINIIDNLYNNDATLEDKYKHYDRLNFIMKNQLKNRQGNIDNGY